MCWSDTMYIVPSPFAEDSPTPKEKRFRINVDARKEILASEQTATDLVITGEGRNSRVSDGIRVYFTGTEAECEKALLQLGTQGG